MFITKDQIRNAKGQELDRISAIMGYSRKGKVFKESDFDFKYRLIELNKKYICSHPKEYRRNSYGYHLGACDICGEVFD